jgi:hypothetical protein
LAGIFRVDNRLEADLARFDLGRPCEGAPAASSLKTEYSGRKRRLLHAKLGPQKVKSERTNPAKY